MNRQRGDILKADNKKYKVDCWADNNIFITTFQNEGLIKNPIFILCDVDEPMNLSDNTAIFYKATNKNGGVYCVPVNIISEIKGEVELPINPILTSVEGVSLGEIVVQSLEGSLSFGGINIRTYISAENEDIENSDKFSELTKALNRVEEMARLMGLLSNGQNVKKVSVSVKTVPNERPDESFEKVSVNTNVVLKEEVEI